MVDASITSGSYTFTFFNGEITRIVTDVNSDLDHMTMPMQNTADSYCYDFGGVSKRISISGRIFYTNDSRVSGYSVKTILEQKQWLETLQTSSQDSATFVSNYDSESCTTSISAIPPYLSGFTVTKVFVESVQFTETEADPEQLAFEIKLIIAQ